MARRQFDSSAKNLPGLLADIDQTFPALATRSRTKTASSASFINIYINDEDIRFLGGDTYAFQDGDEVMLIPSIAGGRCGQRRFLTLPYDESVLQGC